MPRRVAIVHYHLKRGGVTRVIESTLRGFGQTETSTRFVVLAGEVPADCSFAESCRTVAGLAYSNAQSKVPSPLALMAQLREAAAGALGGPPDVWHIHNHSLGKNSALPGLISLLAEDRQPLLLQMHDFAEDGRPANFLKNLEIAEYAGRLYPAAPQVHYAILNQRDAWIFRETGIPPGRLHLLPNPVEGLSGDRPEGPGRGLLSTLGAESLTVYPVRAVRRKNFGELLLWAARSEKGQAFATTLGPTNKEALRGYQRWQELAARYQLPVHFGIGESGEFSFDQIMGSAESILTTSIAEGFGLAFLAPWLFSKPLLGRDLPPITESFKAAGICLDSLYQACLVPVAWIDRNGLLDRLRKALIRSYADYFHPLPPSALAEAWEAITPLPGFVDFGGLDESAQEEVIRHLAEHPSAKEEIQKLPDPGSPELVQANKQAVEREFNLGNYVDRLNSIYQELTEAKPGNPDYLDDRRVLEGFLKPEQFRLLRT